MKKIKGNKKCPLNRFVHHNCWFFYFTIKMDQNLELVYYVMRSLNLHTIEDVKKLLPDQIISSVEEKITHLANANLLYQRINSIRYIHLCTHAIFSLTSTTSQVMQVIETLVLLISHPASTSVDYNKNLYFKLYSALVVLLWNCDHSSDAVSLATCISMLKRHKLSAIEIGELVSNTLDETKIQLEDKHISRVHHCYQEFVRINDNTKSTNKPVLGHKSKSPQQPDEENSQEDLELPVKKKSRIDLRVMREWTEECSMQAQWIDCMVYVDVFQNKNNTKILRWKLSEKPGSKRRVLSNKQSSNCLHEDEIQIIKSEPVTLFCTINLSKTFYNTFPDSAKNMQPNLNAAIILERNYTVIFDSENNNQYTIVPQPKKAHIFPFSDSAPIPQRYPASEHILCRKTTSLSTKLLVKN